jgi:hypothetical protein
MDLFPLFARRSFVFSALACCLMAQTGCGGGGGSDASSAYSGTWDYRTALASNACRLAVDATFNGTLRVTQDGSNVTVQGGSLTLTGTTNDKDGFSAMVTRPAANGCTSGMLIEFRDASDGEAQVAIAIAAECRGRTCAVGYGGTGTRTSTKFSGESETADSSEDTISTITSGMQVGTVGAEGGIENGLEETLMQLKEQQ